jgi:hypothetical protein
MTADDLTRILVHLEEGRTRATFGAVAGLLGVTPRFLMRDRPRDPLHSWVVNKRTGLPSGYPDDACHQDLRLNDRIIRDVDELRAFVGQRETATSDCSSSARRP